MYILVHATAFYNENITNEEIKNFKGNRFAKAKGTII
jgi:hypothetical protein